MAKVAKAVGLAKATNTLSEAIEDGLNLVCLLAAFLDEVTTVVSDSIVECKVLQDQKVDCGGWNKTIYDDLQRVTNEASKYAGNVHELCRCGCDKARNEDIRKELRRGDLTKLTEYIRKQTECIAKCEKSHQVTQERISELISDAQKAAGYCERKAKEAERATENTVVVGGAATAGTGAAVLVGGVAASIVAGIFTAGIGTVVGLAATAASTAAVVGVGGAATICVATVFYKTEKKFRGLQRSFEHAQSCAMRVQDLTCTLKMLVESISNAVDIATPISKYKNTSDLVEAFDWLCAAFGESTSTYRQKLFAIDSELKTKFNTMHIR